MNENQNAVDLVDISTIDVNLDLLQEQRLVEFIRQVKDPFYTRCSKYKIRAHFRKNGPSIEDIIIRMKTN